MKKEGIRALYLILVLAILLCGCSSTEVERDNIPPTNVTPKETEEPIEEPHEVEENPATILGTVTYVIDGDTFMFVSQEGNEYKVRMIGIDTPESVHRDESKNTEEGKIASAYTKEKLEGKEVTLELDVETEDQYGRLLAYVWVEGAMFNKILLDEGYAMLMTIPPNVKYVDYLLGD